MASLATGVEVNRTPFTIFFEQTAASADPQRTPCMMALTKPARLQRMN